jgi:hypothetical protein
MILFAAAMTTANFGETTPPAQPDSTFRRPADYYSAPTPHAAFPQWLSLGCGGVALLVLIAVFAGGSWLSSGGFADLMDFSIGMSLGELRGQFVKDLPPVDKAAFESTVETMRANVREKRVAATKLQPFLLQMSSAMADKKVTVDEVRNMTREAARINATARKR